LHQLAGRRLLLPVAGWPSSSSDTLQTFNLSFKIFRFSALQIPFGAMRAQLAQQMQISQISLVILMIHHDPS
jgi:hypothetical protein